jgi:hypothetical protein
VCILSTYVNEEWGDGEGPDSEVLSLLTCILTYISLGEVAVSGIISVVIHT